MIRVLFVCEGNRARSQMAEAMLRHHGAGRFEVFSAGIRPGDEVPAFTIEALREAHYPAGGLRSKHLSEFAAAEFDYVIVLCDTIRAEAPDLPGARVRLDWPIDDPGDLGKRGIPIEEALRQNRLDLRSHIVRFMESVGCIFCAIVRGDADASFVHRDDAVSAFMDIRPITEGHTLIIPNEHYVTMDDVPDEIAGQMTALSSRIGRALRGKVKMDGYNLFVANGEAAGQEVFHVHMHIIPRSRGDNLGFRFPEGYGRVESRERLDALAEALRRSIPS